MGFSVGSYSEGLNSTHLNSTTTNSTFQTFENDSSFQALPEELSQETIILRSLMFITLIVVMLCMGCEIDPTQLLYHMKKPIGICIGMLSQFVIMPLSAYLLLQTISVNPMHATSLLIIACCPGGGMSNIFCYVCDADLSLSVAMTALSSLLAMGMLPLNLWIYGRSFTTESLVVPYQKLAISLLCTAAPVVVGMLIRWRAPRITTWITKIGCYASLLVMIGCLVTQIVIFPDMFSGNFGDLLPIVIGLPFLGFTVSYILSLALGQSPCVRKAVAIECGVQNFPTALAIISVSFSIANQKLMLPIPWIYCFSMLVCCTVYCCCYQACIKLYPLLKAEIYSNALKADKGEYFMSKDATAVEQVLLANSKELPFVIVQLDKGKFVIQEAF